MRQKSWWGGDGDYLGRNEGVRVTEDRYEYFLSAWGVGYTADGRAVSKYHYFSEYSWCAIVTRCISQRNSHWGGP
jgi:hypothetical protein